MPRGIVLWLRRHGPSNRLMVPLRKLLPLLSAWLVLAGGSSRAVAAEFYTEDLRIPMAEAGPQGLEALLVRPAGAKRYPLALLSHGSPRSFDDRAAMSAHRYYGIALEYARRGFAALIVMRRGYGSTAMHLSSIAIGVGRALMPSVVRHGAAAGSGKCSAHTAL